MISGLANIIGNSIVGGHPSAGGGFTNLYSTEYDGVDGYIALPSYTTHSDDLSVSFWIKGINVGLANVLGGIGLFQAFGSLDTTGRFFIYNFTAGGWKEMFDGTFFDGTWKHAVITCENKSIVKAYANGVLQNTYTFGGNMNASQIYTIGRYGSSGIRYYSGNIDELALFNSVLTQSEITDIYNSGTPNDLIGYSSLTNWWRFEEGSGTTAADSKGTVTGTLYNGSSFSTDVP